MVGVSKPRMAKKPVDTMACSFLECFLIIRISLSCLPATIAISKDQSEKIRQRRELTTVAFFFVKMFSKEVPQHTPLPSS